MCKRDRSIFMGDDSNSNSPFTCYCNIVSSSFVASSAIPEETSLIHHHASSAIPPQRRYLHVCTIGRKGTQPTFLLIVCFE